MALLTLAGALGLTGAAYAQYSPVALTPGSFQYDIVVEKEAPPPLANFADCTVGSGTNNTGFAFFERLSQGRGFGSPAFLLPSAQPRLGAGHGRLQFG